MHDADRTGALRTVGERVERLISRFDVLVHELGCVTVIRLRAFFHSPGEVLGLVG
jgi:hypothetical protein